jgi:hypothetical protein
MSFNYLTNSQGVYSDRRLCGQMVDHAVDGQIERLSQRLDPPNPAAQCLNRPCELVNSWPDRSNH